jgi:hypothetical protein
MKYVGKVGPFLIEVNESGGVFFTVMEIQYIRDYWPEAFRAWEAWKKVVNRSIIAKFFIQNSIGSIDLMITGSVGNTEFNFKWIQENNEWLSVPKTAPSFILPVYK